MHLLCCQPLLLRLGSIVYIGIASMMTESGNVYRLSLTNLGMLILSITNFESYTGSSAVRLEKSRHNICKGSREARLWQVLVPRGICSQSRPRFPFRNFSASASKCYVRHHICGPILRLLAFVFHLHNHDKPVTSLQLVR